MVDADTARAFQEAKNSFDRLVAIQKDLDRVFKAMKRVKPESEEHQALDRKFNELHKEWSRAHRVFAEAQDKFMVYARQIAWYIGQMDRTTLRSSCLGVSIKIDSLMP